MFSLLPSLMPRDRDCWQLRVVKYRNGKKNVDADGLSRCKHLGEEKTIFPDMLKAISHSLSVMPKD